MAAVTRLPHFTSASSERTPAVNSPNRCLRTKPPSRRRRWSAPPQMVWPRRCSIWRASSIRPRLSIWPCSTRVPPWSCGRRCRWLSSCCPMFSALRTSRRRLSAAGIPERWALFYSRGIALERSGQWKLSETDLLHALELKPDQALVLNYLGYSWIDRGENLDRGLKMIEKAVELRPEDGYI